MKEIICPHCKDKNIKKDGVRTTEKRGKIQRYKCKLCNYRFVVDDGFYRMRNNPSIITMSIDMYISNLSSRKMRNQLSRHLNTKISHMSILDWVRRYTLKVSKFVDKLGYNMGNSFYADENLIDCGGRDDRFLCCINIVCNHRLTIKRRSNNSKKVRYFTSIRIQIFYSETNQSLWYKFINVLGRNITQINDYSFYIW
jgi:transposase-like protein